MINRACDWNFSPLKILLVEDDEIDHIAFTRMVGQMTLPYDYMVAASLAEAVEILSNETFDIAILDYNLGDGSSLELFSVLKAKHCPFIISTGSGNEETAAELMKQGAYDYLIKDPDRNYLKILPSVIDKVIARKKAEEQLKLLTKAMENVEDGIYITDLNGTLLFINYSLRKMCGMPDEENLIGQSIHVLAVPALSEQIKTVPHEGKIPAMALNVIFSIPGRETCYGLLSESLMYNHQGQVRVGVISDVTSLKRLELELRQAKEHLEQQVQERTAELQISNERLQQENLERLQAQQELSQLNQTLEMRVKDRTFELQTSEQRYRSVIESLTVGVIVHQADDKIIACNRSAERILGLTTEQLMGLTSVDFEQQTIHEDGSPFPVEEYPATVTLRTGQPQSDVSMGISSGDGKITWLSINSCPLYHPAKTQPYAVVVSFADVTEQRQARKVLQWKAEQGIMMAMTDGLTEVPNRRYFDKQLQVEWKRAIRSQEYLSLIMLDIDYFKKYNDQYGHPVGDICLIQVAKAAQKQMKRPGDILARYGGEEFAVILPDTDITGAIAIAKSIQRAVQELNIPHQKAKNKKIVTVSMGVASLIPKASLSPSQLITIADEALYRAKEQGRDQFVLGNSSNF